MEILGIILLILSYLIQVFFYRKYFRHSWDKKRDNQENKPSVSLIICGKNEAENIKLNLSLICEQDYSNYEVLYMDDHSTDDTERVVLEMSAKFSHFRYIKASESIRDKPGKKWALEEARKMAKNEIILLTDADCYPTSSSWISHMVSKFDNDIDVVLGIGRYEAKKGMLNGLIQYETLFTAMSYLGLASGGDAYMGVGRNLAYTSSISSIKDEKGKQLMSGDDDLFLQAHLKGSNAALCIESEAQTISKAPIDMMSWIRQKTRHYSTGVYYPGKVKFLLLLLKLSFYLPNFIILCLLFGVFSKIAVGLFVLRTTVWLVYFNKIRRELHFPRQIYLLPCYELFFSLFDSWITIKNLMTMPRHWK